MRSPCKGKIWRSQPKDARRPVSGEVLENRPFNLHYVRYLGHEVVIRMIKKKYRWGLVGTFLLYYKVTILHIILYLF